jgi:small-conductance mechanosensitive channel
LFIKFFQNFLFIKILSEERGDSMKLTPPTNVTYGISLLLGVLAIVLGILTGFATSTYLALAGLALLALGNYLEKW